jgi:RimJ/RimL family protein N-acetyltransferase
VTEGALTTSTFDELAKTLETDRLTLRMLRAADFDAFAEMYADPDVTRYLGDGAPLDRPAAWRHLAMMSGHWILRGYGLWAVEERSSKVMVGRVGFWNPEGWPGFELGWVFRRSSWGQGYATEAARAALDHGFICLNQPRVISLIQPDNKASIRVAERLGQRLVGSRDVSGKAVLVYEISREEWESTNVRR